MSSPTTITSKSNPRKRGKKKRSPRRGPPEFSLSAPLQGGDALFHSFFDHAGSGFALTSPDGHFIKVNPALCSMFGYPESPSEPLHGKHDGAGSMEPVDEMVPGNPGRQSRAMPRLPSSAGTVAAKQ
jgi:PAS domain-containing protein